MDLTVVIASIDSAWSIDQCLRHLEHSCAGLQAEFIVVDASHDAAASLIEASGSRAILVRCPPGTLAPVLWAQGLARSTGRVVAFTTGHCLVTPGWAAALMQAIRNGASGAGGPLVIGDGTTPLDWAIFYLRYARFMPHTLGTGRITGEIAGDNAAYAREALDRHTEAFARGFWEVDFHKLIRADGGWLAAVPEAVIEYSRSFRAATILRHRYAHGQQFGSGRVAGGSRKAWQVVLAAPLVPIVLACRAAPHATGGPYPWRFLLALPWFVLLAGAWAAGEAVGALRPSSRRTA